jgi:regulation of enolase protein 1 (concanavalin A-like superfamily)
MRTARFFFFIVAISISISFTADNPTGAFQHSQDIGKPKLAGSSIYNEATKEYRLRGSGYNIWFARDEFQFLFKKISGDFTVTADFEFVGAGTDPHRKVGWMVRESLSDDAAHISAVAHGDGLTVLQWRVKKGMMMRDPEDEIFSPQKNIQTIQVERKGNEYTMRVAKKGEALQIVGAHQMPDLPTPLFVGLYICSHNPEKVEEAIIRNVQLVQAKP